MKTHFSGPVVSKAGFIPGASLVGLTLLMEGTIAVDPASALTQTTQEVALTIAGVAAGDLVIMNLPASFESGLAFAGCYVSATNTVKVRIANISAGTIDGSSRNWSYAVLRIA